MRSPTHQLQVEKEKESHRSQSSVCAHHTMPGYRWIGERVMSTIKCMRSPHTSYRWRGERESRANQVYALTTHQLQVDRRESHRANQVYALTTHQLQVERRKRVIETIKCLVTPFKRLIHSGTNTSLLRVRDAKLCLVLFLLSK